jgi:hypothetical protein
MKKLPRTPETCYFPIVNLDPHSLSQIKSAYKAHNSEVTFTDEYFEYESLEELINKKGDSVGKLKIKGDSGVSIRFERSMTAIQLHYGFRSNPEDFQLFYELKDILERNVSFTTFIFPRYSVYVCVFILTFMSTSVGSEIVTENESVYTRAFIFLAIYTILACIVRTGCGYTISLKPKSNDFFEKVKEKFLVNALVSGISVVATLILGKFFDFF